MFQAELAPIGMRPEEATELLRLREQVSREASALRKQDAAAAGRRRCGSANAAAAGHPAAGELHLRGGGRSTRKSRAVAQ